MKNYDFTPSKVSTQNIWRSVQVFSEREEDYPAMEKVLKQRGFSLEDVSYYRLFPAGTDKGPGIGLPLYLFGELCGYQRYHPGMEPTYKTHGKRGVAGTAQALYHLVICEGMFDYFALYKALRYFAPKICVTYLAGNQLSKEQLQYLLEKSWDCTMFYLALDNDYQYEIAKMYQQIAPYRKVKKATPPVQYGKDWDEAFRDYPKESLDEWRIILYGH